ncbi:unnamed protein product [Cochlearia groenlandica]
MATVTKLSIKFGPESYVKTFPCIKTCVNSRISEKSIEEAVIKPSNKRGLIELEEVQANKKQKLVHGLSTQCLTLLRLLMDHHLGWIFREPVDPARLNIPNYFTVVSKPMDLGTIRSKLLKSVYKDEDEFAADVRLTFGNAMAYNAPDNTVHKMAKDLKRVFEVRWESLKKKKALGLSAIEVKKGPERKSCEEADCVRGSSNETPTSSGVFSVESTKPMKEKPKDVCNSPKLVNRQSKNDTSAITTDDFATKLRTRRLELGAGVNATVKTPVKGSAPISVCKCGSCGRIICTCLKSFNSSGSEVSIITDCHAMNTSSAHTSESEPRSNGSVNSRIEKSGSVSSQLDKLANRPLSDFATESKVTVPVMPPLPPEKALRASMLKDRYADVILRAKHENGLEKSGKAKQVRIQREKEQMEKTLLEEKARIEDEMRAVRAAELKQMRDIARFEREKVKRTVHFDADEYSRLKRDMFNLCGSSFLTSTQLLELGLVLKKDDVCVEEMETETEELEEGEIL